MAVEQKERVRMERICLERLAMEWFVVEQYFALECWRLGLGCLEHRGQRDRMELLV